MKKFLVIIAGDDNIFDSISEYDQPTLLDFICDEIVKIDNTIAEYNRLFEKNQKHLDIRVSEFETLKLEFAKADNQVQVNIEIGDRILLSNSYEQLLIIRTA